MAENKNKRRFVMVVTAIVTFVACSWLIANWDAFKAGLSGRPEPQAASQP